jgi:hypothetical protein
MKYMTTTNCPSSNKSKTISCAVIRAFICANAMVRAL